MSEISPNVEINDSLKEKQGSDEFIDPNKRIDTSRTMSPPENEEVNPNARCFEVGQKESSDDSFVDPNKRIDVTRTIGHSEDIEVTPNDRYEGREDARINRPPIINPNGRINEASNTKQDESKDTGYNPDKESDKKNTEVANSDPENVEESDSKEELTEDKINEKQKEAIKDAIKRILRGEQLTKEELGNLGEMMMDQYYISQGYTPLNKHRVTSLDDKKDGFRTGIDGVYEKTNPDGTKTYVIADAKYNTSQLSDTNDGKQMSDNWIDKRLDDAVGKEKADEIRDAAEDDPDSVKHEVFHIDPNMDENGNIHTDVQAVDADGNKVGEKTVVETYDSNGNLIQDATVINQGEKHDER